MVLLTVFLQPRLNRIANIVLSLFYAVTIIAGALGEWGYYVFGSAVEVLILIGIAYLAWTWPRASNE